MEVPWECTVRLDGDRNIFTCKPEGEFLPLPHGGTATVLTTYTATHVGMDKATLTVSTDLPDDTPRVVTLVGEGVENPPDAGL